MKRSLVSLATLVIVLCGAALAGTPNPKDYATEFVVQTSESHANTFGSYDPGPHCSMWLRSEERAYFVEQGSNWGVAGSCTTFMAGTKLQGRKNGIHIEILSSDKHDNLKVQKYKIRMTAQ